MMKYLLCTIDYVVHEYFDLLFIAKNMLTVGLNSFSDGLYN